VHGNTLLVAASAIISTISLVLFVPTVGSAVRRVQLDKHITHTCSTAVNELPSYKRKPLIDQKIEQTLVTNLLPLQ